MSVFRVVFAAVVVVVVVVALLSCVLLCCLRGGVPKRPRRPFMYVADVVHTAFVSRPKKNTDRVHRASVPLNLPPLLYIYIYIYTWVGLASIGHDTVKPAAHYVS